MGNCPFKLLATLFPMSPCALRPQCIPSCPVPSGCNCAQFRLIRQAYTRSWRRGNASSRLGSRRRARLRRLRSGTGARGREVRSECSAGSGVMWARGSLALHERVSPQVVLSPPRRLASCSSESSRRWVGARESRGKELRGTRDGTWRPAREAGMESGNS